MERAEITVFVLDDDSAVQDSLAALMQVIELPVECYATVDDFLKAFDPNRKGCLLLDIRLPGDGFSLLRQLSAQNCKLPVIVITGHGDEETREKAVKLGAAAFFEKPFNPQQLCNRVEEVVDLTYGRK